MGVTWIKYNREHRSIEQVLSRLERLGDYCTSGRVVAPMPQLEVDGAGMISFPVPSVHVDSLIEAAQPAPYGRAGETIVDRSVRDSWQVDASKVHVGGPGWSETFNSVLKTVAEGLGYPQDGLEAQLYKLLIYEKGGFFAEHRDSEKVAGMVGTLVVSLPVAGTGGDLIVRHGDRETAVDLCVRSPSELAYGAFYADCTHETVPVLDGNRVSLVYNLVLKDKQAEWYARVPMLAEFADRTAGRLTEWAKGGSGSQKIVWVMDHYYTPDGLSFDRLKGADQAVARVLADAARAAQCSLHAAILHIEEKGKPFDEGGYHDRSSLEEFDVDAADQWECWLDDWVAEDGSSPAFGRLDVRDREVLPADALADAESDSKMFVQGIGNEGVAVELTYSKAVLVVWPTEQTVPVVADSSIKRAMPFLEAWVARAGTDALTGPVARSKVRLVLDAWEREYGSYRVFAEDLASRFLCLLAKMEDEQGTRQFLARICKKRYTGDDNDGLIAAIAKFGPRILEGFLPHVVESKVDRYLGSIVNLTWAAWQATPDDSPEVMRDVTRPAVQALLSSLPRILEGVGIDGRKRYGRRESLDAACVARLLQLGWRFGKDREADDAALLVIQNPKLAPPDRVIPSALALLEDPGAHGGTPAFRTLWSHAARFVLERTAERPTEPRDWRIVTRVGCYCEPCRALQAFCDDPVERTWSYEEHLVIRNPLYHIESQIERLGLPLEKKTATYRRPYKFVFEKSRAEYLERLDKYERYVDNLRKLIGCFAAGEATGDIGYLFRRLEAARQLAE